MTSSNGNIFRVTGHLCGEFTGPRWIPRTKAVTPSFDVFFDLRLNKRLSKQSWGWWFETLSRSLRRHRNASFLLHYHFDNRRVAQFQWSHCERYDWNLSISSHARNREQTLYDSLNALKMSPVCGLQWIVTEITSLVISKYIPFYVNGAMYVQRCKKKTCCISIDWMRQTVKSINYWVFDMSLIFWPRVLGFTDIPLLSIL